MQYLFSIFVEAQNKQDEQNQQDKKISTSLML